MRVIVALGGNALLRRGEPLSVENQCRNIRIAAKALAPIALAHQLVITHGNGPQVGLLALKDAVYEAKEAYPLDVLDAETEGQIGYLVEQELRNVLPATRRCATLLTQIEVDPGDPAFGNPTKPIGPLYNAEEALRLETERGWRFALDGEGFRRVVASPMPKRILDLEVIEMLVERDVVVICAGGGGIPTVRRDDGRLIGVEAVIDKDRASALLATALKADVLMMLTDVDAAYAHWSEPGARRIRLISPEAVQTFHFAPGTMGPKVEAACDFTKTTAGIAAIGALKDASAILAGDAGTTIRCDGFNVAYWD